MEYIKVAVFTKTKELADIFTYSSKQKLGVGRIVKVPFRNRELYGVSLETTKKPDFKAKEIITILDESTSLPKHLMQAAFFISQYYHAPFSLVLKTMLPNGFYKKRREAKDMDDSSTAEIKEKPYLTEDQKKAINQILNPTNKKPFLIHGVTGSGKTEIYLRALEETLKQGKQAIVLVPEIALTPQTVLRFEERFPKQIAIINSHLKETEKQANWNALRSGDKKVAIGSRSAIFAPLKNLGLIIIDEEHDASYKQDSTPRYDTRKVAEFISKETGAKIILGSATPSVESYKKSLENKYSLLQLNKRVTQELMPEVKIIDLRQEFKNTPNSVFSFELEKKINEVLENNRKIILFLNRRGNATYVFCRDCGFAEKCKNCDIPLIHHFTEKENVLKCHHCGLIKQIPLKCPNCSSLAIKYFGLGIQRVESEIKTLFPKAITIRMDKDTVKEKDSYEKIFKEFKNGKTNILLGTQMVAKGWDIPDVDLVGVISADNALNFPDFKANERSFQLLTQVSGRPGRRDSRGLALIQTFNPESPVLSFVKNHDYESFFKSEIKERKAFFYPPYSRIIKLTVKNPDEKKCVDEAKKLKLELETYIASHYNEKLIVALGPSPCFIQKIAGKFRWQILLKFDKNFNQKELEKLLAIVPKNWAIDIDPLNIL